MNIREKYENVLSEVRTGRKRLKEEFDSLPYYKMDNEKATEIVLEFKRYSNCLRDHIQVMHTTIKAIDDFGVDSVDDNILEVQLNQIKALCEQAIELANKLRKRVK